MTFWGLSLGCSVVLWSLARACCVTRARPGAGVSPLVFNIIIRWQESSELQNGATRGQPGLLILGCVIVTNACCFHYRVSGRTEEVNGSTIKIHFLFKAGRNFSVNCFYKWILSFWENSLNLLSPAVCRDIGSSLTQHGNHLFFYFHAAAPGEACSPSWDTHEVVSKWLKSAQSQKPSGFFHFPAAFLCKWLNNQLPAENPKLS